MFLWSVAFAGSITTELPRPNLRIDPRPIFYMVRDDPPLDITYHDDGRTVTLAFTDHHGEESNFHICVFRVYDPATENVPSFESTNTTYNYCGMRSGENFVEGHYIFERAPRNTVVATVDPSVKIIRETAFCRCSKLKYCFLHDDVEVIEIGAFEECKELKIIKLPKNLKRIGPRAFAHCEALDAIFIPPTVDQFGEYTDFRGRTFPTCPIGDEAFVGCSNMSIVAMPANITTDQLGTNILRDCDTFFRLSEIPGYPHHNVNITWNGNQMEVGVVVSESAQEEGGGEEEEEVNEAMVQEVIPKVVEINAHLTNRPEPPDEQTRLEIQASIVRNAESKLFNQSLVDFYHNLPVSVSPLHKICLTTEVSPQAIHDCIHSHPHSHGPATALTTDRSGMTPLHILAMNPHATMETVLKCFHLNMSAAFLRDHCDMMPLDYLWKYGNLECLLPIIQALCLHREATHSF